MPDEAPAVDPNNTHYMFGTVDTAHGGNGSSLHQMAPHLFGDQAVAPTAFEHLPHAVEFEYPEQAEAARHVTSDRSLAITEAARVASALGETPEQAAERISAASAEEDLYADHLAAVADMLSAAAQAALDAREAEDEGSGDASVGDSATGSRPKAATKKASAKKAAAKK